MAVALLASACAGPKGEPAPGEGSCADVFADGVEVTAELGDVGCEQENGRTLLPLWFTLECSDGRTLAYNEFGWGYLGSQWTTGDHSAAEAACRG